jgi:hypothetical protein
MDQALTQDGSIGIDCQGTRVNRHGFRPEAVGLMMLSQRDYHREPFLTKGLARPEKYRQFALRRKQMASIKIERPAAEAGIRSRFGAAFEKLANAQIENLNVEITLLPVEAQLTVLHEDQLVVSQKFAQAMQGDFEILQRGVALGIRP